MPARNSGPYGVAGNAASAYAPRLTPFLIDRPRLRGRLDERAVLTVLRAPVGFGKTTLVAQWVARRKDPTELVIWLRGRPGTDATAFWSDALRVLADAEVPVPPDAVAPTSPRDLSGQVERALRRVDSRIVLVVDNFQHITASDVDQTWLDIVRHTPHLRLIVCVRGSQHFRAQHYLDLDVVELGGRDLLFTEKETQRLAATAGAGLPTMTTSAVHEATGGWPEPTRAVFLRLREVERLSTAEVVAIVESAAADYLRERILPESVPPTVFELALRTSLPEQFTADVAARLTDDPEVDTQLHLLEKAGILAVELQDGRRHYRWPSAVRRALLNELARRRPDRIGDLHARLGRAYLDDARVELALRHAIEAEDWPLAIQAIESGWRQLAYGHHDDLVRAFIAIPMEHVISSPRALAMRDTNLNVPDDHLLAAARLPASSRALAELGRREGVGDMLDTCLAVVIALRLRGAFDRARSYGTRAMEIAHAARASHPSDVLDLLPSLHLQLGMAHLLGGDAGAATEALERAYDLRDDHPWGHAGVDAAGKLALVHAHRGDLPVAQIWLERHAGVEELDTWLKPRIASPGTAARLLTALDRLDLHTASNLDDELAAHVQRDELWPFLTLARGQYALHTGRPADALSMIDRARMTYSRWQEGGAVASTLLAGLEADALLALGRGNAAKAALTRPDGHHDLLVVGTARLALLSGESRTALNASADSRWERAASVRHRAEMLLIRAVAAHRIGDRAVAAEALRRALAVVRDRGLLRAFTTLPRPALDELAEIEPAVRDLLDDEPLASHPGLFPMHVVVVRLTEREQRVLEDIAAGLTAPQIAKASVLSYNTVRSQQQSLYKKLGASDRTEAIAKARRWGLLPPAR